MFQKMSVLDNYKDINSYSARTFAGLFSTLAKVIKKERNKYLCLLLLLDRAYLFDRIYKSSITCVCINFLSAYFNTYYAEQDNGTVKLTPLISAVRMGHEGPLEVNILGDIGTAVRQQLCIVACS